MKLPQLPADKAQHVSYGAALGLVGAVTSTALGQPAWLGALVLAACAAAFKEVRDRTMRDGTPDLWDAVATVAGALPCVIVGAWLS